MIGRRTALALGGSSCLLGVAALQYPGEVPLEDAVLGATLFPDLPMRLPQAARVEITHAGSTLVVLRTPSGWVVPGHAGYPIRPAVLHSLLAALSDLRLRERRTDNPALYARLGVDDIGRPDASGTLLAVWDDHGGCIASVLFGHGADGVAPETYVRLPNDAQAWLAAGALDASSDWLDWVDRTVVDILPERVRSLTSQRADGPSLTVEPRGDTWVLAPSGNHPPLDPFRLADMGRALSHVSFMDVAAGDAAPGEPIGRADVTLRDGLMLQVTATGGAAGLWLRLAADGPGSEALRARLAPWAFRVSDAVEAALFPSLSDLAAFQIAAMPAPASARVHRR